MGGVDKGISLLFPFSLAAPLSFTTGSGFLVLFSLLLLSSRLLNLHKMSLHKLNIWQLRKTYGTVRRASKIKLKNANKTRTVTVRRVIFFLTFSRHPSLIWLHCCLHQYKTLKAVATATAAISKGQNLTYSLSPSLLRLLTKNFQRQKLLLGSLWRQSKQKSMKKALKSPVKKQRRFY